MLVERLGHPQGRTVIPCAMRNFRMIRRRIWTGAGEEMIVILSLEDYSPVGRGFFPQLLGASRRR